MRKGSIGVAVLLVALSQGGVEAVEVQAGAPAALTPAACVRDDTVVCTFRAVDAAELAKGVAVQPVAGMPPVARVALGRLPDGRMVLWLIYAPGPDLQGVAL